MEFRKALLEILGKAQVNSMPLVRNGIAWIDREASSELAIGPCSVKIKESSNHGQGDMCLHQILVYFGCALGGCSCARKCFLRRTERKRPQHCVAIRQTGVCKPINGIPANCLLEVFDSSIEGVARTPVPQVPPFEIELICLTVPSRAAPQMFLIGDTQLDPKNFGDLPRNVLLDEREVAEITAVFLTPQLRSGGWIDQFGLYIQRIAPLHDSPSQQHAHIQFAHRAVEIQFQTLVAEHRATRQYAQLGDLRKIVDKAFGNAIAKVIEIWVAPGIDERKYRDRIDGWRFLTGRGLFEKNLQSGGDSGGGCEAIAWLLCQASRNNVVQVRGSGDSRWSVLEDRSHGFRRGGSREAWF